MSKTSIEVDEAERLRISKLEEALEIESLRRIICAYLNYGDAAEDDVRRYEQSFKKLPLKHKALLSHYPQKFKSLRRCISANMFFIHIMLQTFESPFDMSEDPNSHEHAHMESAHNGSLCSKVSNGGVGRQGTETVERSNNIDLPGDGDCCLRFQGEEANQIFDSDNRETEKNVSEDEFNCNGNGHSVPCGCSDPYPKYNVPLVDVDKVRCVVRNIVRDWAAEFDHLSNAIEEGQTERDQCYKPILEELVRLFPDLSKESPPSCLVPGAGLGRLALEISSLGFVSQGNEFSYYMMICSSFILNHAQEVGEWTIYPWIHSNCNSLSERELRAVPVPDILPASAGITEGFSMCAGDFVEVYSDPSQIGAWDAVVTCFFLDTAHNIVEYIEIISKILKDGGEMSIELSLADRKKVVLYYGFEIERESTVETTYTTNTRSMMQNRYFAAFWTMRNIPTAS